MKRIRTPNTTCKYCEAPIYRSPLYISRGPVFCSKTCNGLSRRITFTCQGCGIETWRENHGIHRTHKFCTNKCAVKFKSNDNNPQGRDMEKYRRWNKERHDKNNEIYREMKSQPCTDCHNIFPHYIMEFDHVPERGILKKRIAALVGSRSWNAKTLQDELAKCDLVCANCHKIRTYERRTNTDGR